MRIVDLKFLCGFTMPEIAALQRISERTAQRQWEKDGGLALVAAIGAACAPDLTHAAVAHRLDQRPGAEAHARMPPRRGGLRIGAAVQKAGLAQLVVRIEQRAQFVRGRRIQGADLAHHGAVLGWAERFELIQPGRELALARGTQMFHGESGETAVVVGRREFGSAGGARRVALCPHAWLVLGHARSTAAVPGRDLGVSVRHGVDASCPQVDGLTGPTAQSPAQLGAGPANRCVDRFMPCVSM